MEIRVKKPNVHSLRVCVEASYGLCGLHHSHVMMPTDGTRYADLETVQGGPFSRISLEDSDPAAAHLPRGHPGAARVHPGSLPVPPKATWGHPGACGADWPMGPRVENFTFHGREM